MKILVSSSPIFIYCGIIKHRKMKKNSSFETINRDMTKVALVGEESSDFSFWMMSATHKKVTLNSSFVLTLLPNLHQFNAWHQSITSQNLVYFINEMWVRIWGCWRNDFGKHEKRNLLNVLTSLWSSQIVSYLALGTCWPQIESEW